MDSVPGDSSVSIIRGLLVARLPSDMAPDALRGLLTAMLAKLQSQRCRFAVIDCAQVEVMDNDDAAFLLRALSAGSLMGAAPVLCGLCPGVAAFLAGLDQRSLRGVRIARDLDDALSLETPE
jgi:anti-anti-sigma regulatory factor